MEEKGRALTSVKQLLHARQSTGHFKCRYVVVMEEVMGRAGTVTQVSRTKCSMGAEQIWQRDYGHGALGDGWVDRQESNREGQVRVGRGGWQLASMRLWVGLGP